MIDLATALGMIACVGIGVGIMLGATVAKLDRWFRTRAFTRADRRSLRRGIDRLDEWLDDRDAGFLTRAA